MGTAEIHGVQESWGDKQETGKGSLGSKLDPHSRFLKRGTILEARFPLDYFWLFDLSIFVSLSRN